MLRAPLLPAHPVGARLARVCTPMNISPRTRSLLGSPLAPRENPMGLDRACS